MCWPKWPRILLWPLGRYTFIFYASFCFVLILFSLFLLSSLCWLATSFTLLLDRRRLMRSILWSFMLISRWGTMNLLLLRRTYWNWWRIMRKIWTSSTMWRRRGMNSWRPRESYRGSWMLLCPKLWSSLWWVRSLRRIRDPFPRRSLNSPLHWRRNSWRWSLS